MRLELGHVLIKDVQFGNETKLEKGVLTVNKDVYKRQDIQRVN